MVSLATDTGTVLLSPSDITRAAACEFDWMSRGVDPAAGLAPRHAQEDAFLERVSALGDAHEARVLQVLKTPADGAAPRVVELEKPRPYTPQNIAAAVERTREALAAGPDVVFQAMLHDGEFGGLADFLVRDAAGAYTVVDTKLARHARVTALLQIAAYADLLDGMGVPRTRHGELWLGTWSAADAARKKDTGVVRADLDEIIPVYRHQRRRLQRLAQEHVDAGVPARWGDDRLSVCGQCAACTEAVAEHHDVLLTAGATRLQRARLRAGGIETIEQLAASVAPPPGVSERAWRRLRDQAALQLAPAEADGRPPFAVVDPAPIMELPASSPGDIFFDFEGDPLWVSAGGQMEGLEYLWGWVEAPGADAADAVDPWTGSARGAASTSDTASEDFRFTALWAHSRTQEKAALERFIELVEERRARFPEMRIYHYAPYEVTALKRLTVRHGVGEAVLDDWLRAGLFVDLYATVRAALRAGVESYSIKKLEPLYMGADRRAEEGVTTAADSVTEYHLYAAAAEAAAAGDAQAAEEAARLLAGIADYNRYDCVSTVRLRDWLIAQIDDAGRAAVHAATEDAHPIEPAPEPDADLAAELLGLIAPPPAGEEDTHRRTAEEDGLALLAAGLGFYQREDKPMWWAFFDRGLSPTDEWQEPRANVVADRVDVVADWHVPEGRRTQQRVLRVTGTLEPGTLLEPDASAKTVYEDVPSHAQLQPNALRWIGPTTTVEEVEDLPDGRSVLTLRESVKKGAPTHPERPMAAFQHAHIPTGSLQARIQSLAHETAAGGAPPAPGASPSVDILARRSPTTSGRPMARIVADSKHTLDKTGLLVEALQSARGSYVAVQGPPGTGKTHVGSHAVKTLLDQGWSVGVTAQSHAVVENFLGKLVSIGVPVQNVTKAVSGRGRPAGTAPWEEVTNADAGDAVGPGRVVGGTPWTFAREDFPGVDLLVIDEAGQFSLAHTLAASASARTLLLLGDPQQLPQVTRGMHPEPIGHAALDWLMEGHAVLPPERGFFLDRSWRMHSALCAPVSRLSYDRQLESHTPVTDARRLEGIEPGLHPVPVEHRDNAVSSPEEAARVVEIVRDVVGRAWTEQEGAAPRPLTPADVIVVAPYNAQVATVRQALDAAGFEDTTVGTVDRFQGREAPVAILTMAASSPQDVPRGLDFLLSRNRLNVSVSRGQWAAYLVHSPALADALPAVPAELGMIGAFLRLVQG